MAAADQLVASVQRSCFQMGVSRFSRSIASRQPRKAASRWPAIATISTLISPIDTGPDAWRIDSAVRPKVAMISSAMVLRLRVARVGWTS